MIHVRRFIAAAGRVLLACPSLYHPAPPLHPTLCPACPLLHHSSDKYRGQYSILDGRRTDDVARRADVWQNWWYLPFTLFGRWQTARFMQRGCPYVWRGHCLHARVSPPCCSFVVFDGLNDGFCAAFVLLALFVWWPDIHYHLIFTSLLISCFFLVPTLFSCFCQARVLED